MKKPIPIIREREGNEKKAFPKFGNGKGMKKSIPKVRERESEASILGNDREREFPLTPVESLRAWPWVWVLESFGAWEPAWQAAPAPPSTLKPLLLFVRLMQVFPKNTRSCLWYPHPLRGAIIQNIKLQSVHGVMGYTCQLWSLSKIQFQIILTIAHLNSSWLGSPRGPLCWRSYPPLPDRRPCQDYCNPSHCPSPKYPFLPEDLIFDCLPSSQKELCNCSRKDFPNEPNVSTSSQQRSCRWWHCFPLI